MEKKIIYTGQFIGEDRSMGFKTGRWYKFTLEKRKKKPYWIMLRTTNGLWCPYSSNSAIKRNWRLLAGVSWF